MILTDQLIVPGRYLFVGVLVYVHPLVSRLFVCLVLAFRYLSRKSRSVFLSGPRGSAFEDASSILGAAALAECRTRESRKNEGAIVGSNISYRA